ncbi:MAG: hypothetical protein AAFV93_01615 [Chloroflexota bacterium]
MLKNAKVVIVAIVMTLAITIAAYIPTTTTQAQSAIELQSAGALEFGDDGVLFIGDSYGAQVIALETNDTEALTNSEVPVFVEMIDVELAAMLGTVPREIVINDMIVNPVSQNIYLSVHIGRTIDPDVALVRYVRASGELEVLDLAEFNMTSVDIPLAHAFEDELQYGQSIRVLTVTDLTYYGGELFIAGVSNQEFASTLRRVSYPFTDDITVSSIEIFHGAHNRMETHAPIVTSLVYEIEGVPHLIAAYTCTPLVKIPLSSLEDGAHIIGTTMAELGFGSNPVDMLLYQPPEMMGGGGERMLVTHDQRAASSVDPNTFADAELTGPAANPTGVGVFELPFISSLHTDVLNDTFVVSIRRNTQTGDLNMQSLVAGIFFDVGESIAEYNFPDEERSPLPATNPIDYGFDVE